MTEASNGQVTKEEVLAALQQIEDPDLHRDIVSLGFVPESDINICGSNISIRIVLTTPACPVRETMKEQAQQLLTSLPGVEQAEVTMDATVRSTGVGRGPKEIEGVRNIIAVASNKGGVGKSTVAVNLAIALRRFGARVGLMDADLTGPNIPTMLGLGAGFQADTGLGIVERYGIRAASIGFVLKRGLPVVWRGPMIGTGVRQLMHDLPWNAEGELDYLIVDLPPGTSDASMSGTGSADCGYRYRDDAEQRVARGRDEGGDDVREAECPCVRADREHELLHLPELRRSHRYLWPRGCAADGRRVGHRLPG